MGALDIAWGSLGANLKKQDDADLCQMCFGQYASMLANVGGVMTPSCPGCSAAADNEAGGKASGRFDRRQNEYERTRGRMMDFARKLGQSRDTRREYERNTDPTRVTPTPQDETPLTGTGFQVEQDHTAEPFEAHSPQQHKQALQDAKELMEGYDYTPDNWKNPRKDW